ncbi:hypothetical protein [Mycoplasma seminis]|uniref:Uncharacterized protein n=1 Tax=Mycoplasma seminis TaxID=512749 RepID=A0ABY9H9M1_9MOLU|nr:hypothetical protein [Mycoplasma seminis]WLP85285.1 hypothetical protein Q8852_03100 [Mycoplasma seminis]
MSILNLDDVVRLGEDHYIEFRSHKYAIDTSLKSVMRLQKFMEENQEATTLQDFTGKGEQFLRIFFKYKDQADDFIKLVQHTLLNPKQQDAVVYQVFTFWSEHTLPQQETEQTNEKK